MKRKILAGFGGFVTGFVIISVIELLGHLLFPLPADIDFASVESLQANIDRIPMGAMLFVALAHFVGVIVGIFVARKLAPVSCTPAYVVAGLFTAATIINLILIPHPLWFMALDLAAVAVGAYIGLYVLKHPKGKQSPSSEESTSEVVEEEHHSENM